MLIPAVENAISGCQPSARATSSVSRKGITVEIGKHRRRRPADPRRCARARRRGERPIADRRHGDAHRRRARRARPRCAAVLHRRRRRSPPSVCAAAQQTRAIRSGGCRCGAPTTRFLDSEGRATSTTFGAGGLAGSITAAHCSCAAVRKSDKAMAALRYLCLDARRHSRGGRRGAECQAARALYALLAPRYGLNRCVAASTRASILSGPSSPAITCAA